MKPILVTGGAGYLGRNLIEALQKKGYKVKSLVRKTQGKEGEIIGDMRDKEGLKKAVKGCETVIHVAAIIDSRNPDIMQVNVEGTKNLVEACDENNIKKIIFISSTAAIKAVDNYGKSKRDAEEIIRKAKANYVILQPGVIYSKDSKMIQNIMNINRKIPLITPVVGNGKYKVSPIHVKDVTSAIIKVGEDKKIANKTYCIVGPTSLEFNEFVEIINQSIKIKRKKVHIPLFICYILAKVGETLIKNPPLTTGIIKTLKKETFYDITEAQRDFKFNPIEFKKGMENIKWNTDQS